MSNNNYTNATEQEKKEVRDNTINTLLNVSKDMITIISLSNFILGSSDEESKIFGNYVLSLIHPTCTDDEIRKRLDLFTVKKIVIIDINYNSNDDEIRGMTLSNSEKTSNMTYYRLSWQKFFEEETIKGYSDYYSINNPNYIIILRGCTWSLFKLKLKAFNINLSSGNNNLKQLLSPNQYLLSKVIMILYGFNNNIVTESFTSLARNVGVRSPLFDFSNKQIRDIFNIKPNRKKIGNTTQKRSIHMVSKYSYTRNQYVRRLSDMSIKKNNVYYPYLSKLAELINNDSISDMEKQEIFDNYLNSVIDQQLVEESTIVDKHKKSFQNYKKGNLKISITEALTTYQLHKNEKIHRYISNDKEKYIIKLLIICYSIVISYYNRLGYTSIAGVVGKTIIETIYLEKRSAYIRNNKIDSSKFSFQDYLKLEKIDDITFVNIGDYFITLLSQYPHNIFQRYYEKSTKNNKQVATITINKEFINSVKENLILPPVNLPMLIKPSEWSSKKFGGYLRNKYIKQSIITKSSDNKHRTNKKKMLYQAANMLNSVKFGINDLLLGYLLNEGKYILDNNQAKDEIQREITLSLAQTLLTSPFYLTVRSDWRGRLVTESFFITYQGSDLSLALINLWEGEVLTESGKYYFYIYGANSHNYQSLSKKSYTDRIKWVQDNYNKIISLDRELILSAENSFIFTSFCLNMKNLHSNPKWLVRTPVFLDATCSGIQHLSALLRDVELASKVNLTESSHEDVPNDIYTSLLDPINRAVNKYGEENKSHSHLSLIKFDRKTVKQSIMTKVYNVTTHGISTQLQNKMNEDVDNDENKIAKGIISSLSTKDTKYYLCPGKHGYVRVSEYDVMKIAKIINDEIFIVYPSLNSIYNYFIETALILSRYRIPISWVTPNGMEIVQHYFNKGKDNKVAIDLFGKRKTLVLNNYDTDSINIRKQGQAIIPNIIHSLDAAHLIKVVVSSITNNYYPIITIHDCFGTHPNKMEVLSNNVKAEFAILYTKEDFLVKFNKHIISMLKYNNVKVKKSKGVYSVYYDKEDRWINLPPIPEAGKLDINRINNSSYMIT